MPLREMGAAVETDDGHAPVTIHGGPSADPLRASRRERAGEVRRAAGGSLRVGRPDRRWSSRRSTRDHTERMLAAMGARVRARAPARRASGRSIACEPLSIDVPGDISSAAAVHRRGDAAARTRSSTSAASTSTPREPGSSTWSSGWAGGSRSTTGAPSSGEPVGRSRGAGTRSSSPPTSTRRRCRCSWTSCRSSACSPSMARGDSVVARRRRAARQGDRPDRDDDRGAAGARGSHPRDDRTGSAIRGVPTRLRGGTVDSRGDHRIAMLGAVAGLASREGVEIVGAESRRQ